MFSERPRFSDAAAGALLLIACYLVSAVSPLPVQAAESSGFTPMVINRVSPSRQLAMLKAVCDEGTLGIEDGVPVCKVCPAFTSQTGEKNASLRINNVIEGAFTRAGVAEALIDLEGCEPHANLYGGTVLLERTDKGWKRGLYEPGFRADECITFRTIELNQALACNTVDTAQGIQIGEISWISLAGGEYQASSLLRWFDNIQSNPRRLVSVFPASFMKSDFNQDSRVDLSVLVRLRDAPVPAKYPGAIDAIASGHRFAEPETVRLIYLFDGKQLSLSPQSKPGKAQIDKLLEQYL